MTSSLPPDNHADDETQPHSPIGNNGGAENTPNGAPDSSPDATSTDASPGSPPGYVPGFAQMAPYQYQQGYQPAPTPPEQTPRRRRLAPWLLAALAIILVVVGLVIGLGVTHGGANGGASPSNVSEAMNPAATLPVSASAQGLQQQVENVIRTAQPAVAQVQSQGAQGGAIGSGEIVRSDGYIVTNDHVVAGYSQYAVLLSNGKTYPATVVGQDPQDDLAVLKISTGSKLQTIAFGDSSKAQVGQFVVALGSPLGLQQSATFGIVSALNRSASEAPNGPAQELTGLIQTSAPINPGNSGGALVNLQGQLIGVPTLGAIDPNSGGAANGIGFAIPSNRVQFVMNQLIQNGHLVTSGQGFLGVQGEDVTPQLASSYHLSAQSGVLIVGFAPAANGASPAQQAGLRQGDIITGVNGQAISDNNALASALISQAPGAKAKVTYMRGKATNTVSVTLGARPTNNGG